MSNPPNPSGITCQMRPSDSLLRQLGKLGRVDPREAIYIQDAINDLGAVDVFAQLLDEAMTATTTTDGRLDLKDMAAFILKRMKENQKR